jgi:hypothetical protein
MLEVEMKRVFIGLDHAMLRNMSNTVLCRLRIDNETTGQIENSEKTVFFYENIRKKLYFL